MEDCGKMHKYSLLNGRNPIPKASLVLSANLNLINRSKFSREELAMREDKSVLLLKSSNKYNAWKISVDQSMLLHVESRKFRCNRPG